MTVDTQISKHQPDKFIDILIKLHKALLVFTAIFGPIQTLVIFCPLCMYFLGAFYWVLFVTHIVLSIGPGAVMFYAYASWAWIKLLDSLVRSNFTEFLRLLFDGIPLLLPVLAYVERGLFNKMLRGLIRPRTLLLIWILGLVLYTPFWISYTVLLITCNIQDYAPYCDVSILPPALRIFTLSPLYGGEPTLYITAWISFFTSLASIPWFYKKMKHLETAEKIE